MKTPYEILEISEQASDEQVKQAYLAMVRRYPPELKPHMFQKIFSAYDLISSEEKRLAYRLFHSQMPSPEDIAEHLLGTPEPLSCSSPQAFTFELGKAISTYCSRFEL